MGLERSDGALSSVAAVDIGGDELVRGLPSLGDGRLEFLACFVDEDLDVDLVATGLQALSCTPRADVSRSAS